MPDQSNALAGSQPPAAVAAQPPKAASRAVPAAAAPSLNAKPNKDANAGQSPSMMGDVKPNPKPTVQRIAAAAPSAATQRGQSAQGSGIDQAMGALADKLHPPKKR